MRRSIHSGLVGLAALAVASTAAAQDPIPALHAKFVGGYESPTSSYGDVWGDGDFAYVARYGQAEVDIIDISTPSSPSLAATFVVPAPDEAASAQDVKVADGLLFISLESADPNGVLIVDVRDPYSPQLLTRVDTEPGFFEQIHNTFYADGWLYMSNSSDNTISIVDLRSYDPDNAPATITSWDYMIDDVGSIFVHDITVQDGRLYASAWDSLIVYDVSNLGTQAPQLIGSTRGINTHAAWATTDGQYVITGEERQGGGLRLYEVRELGGGLIELLPRDSFRNPLAKTYSTHNPLILGDRIYASYYQSGTYVVEIDRTTKTLEVVAHYDCSTSLPFGYSGNWGVYPYLGLDRVLMSDIQNGLVVVDLSAIQISFPTARPELIVPGAPQAITVELTELGNDLVDATMVNLWSRVNGGAFSATPMSFLGGNQWQADLPVMSCNSAVDYYVSVDDLSGETFTDPADAPTRFHTAWAGSGTIPILVDDFQNHLGWNVTDSGVTSGSWTRANPVGTGAQPEDGDPDVVGGSRCYFTGQGPIGGSSGDADLDGGPTQLTSPLLDFSGGDGLIRYSRWFFNDDGDGDSLLVEISDDGGSSWAEVEEISDYAGGWVKRVIRVSDFVNTTSQVVVRYTATDNPNNSVTEAAIDEFSAEGFDCASLATAISRTGVGSNPDVYTNTTLPIIGTNWLAEIDTSGFPSAFQTYVIGFEQPLDPGVQINVGELLVNVFSPVLIESPATPVGSVSTHVIPVPNLPALQDLHAATQGVVFGGGVALTNAIDIVVNY